MTTKIPITTACRSIPRTFHTHGSPTARRASAPTRARCDTKARMRVSVPHNTDRDTARRKVEARLKQLLSQYGSYLNGVDQRWEGDRLVFSGSARGFKAD